MYENIAPSYWFLSPEDKNIAILVKLFGAAGLKNTQSINPAASSERKSDWIDRIEEAQETVKENIEYDIIRREDKCRNVTPRK